MPSRRDPDVLRLPGSKPPAEHPLSALDPRKPRKRRRAAPEPAEDPRDEMMRTVIGRVQAIGGRLNALTNELQLARLEIELHRRRIVALETAAQARQEPAGDVGAPGAGESAAGG